MKRQGKDLKYHKPFERDRMIFIGDDGRRLVIINRTYAHAHMTSGIAKNGNTVWIDEKTGETFEIEVSQAF